MEVHDFKSSSDGETTVMSFQCKLTKSEQERFKAFVDAGKLPELERALKETFSATAAVVGPYQFRDAERKQQTIRRNSDPTFDRS